MQILLNACCPGWVRTDMAGPKAPKSPEEGAITPVYLALLPPGATEPHGKFVSDKEVQVWWNGFSMTRWVDCTWDPLFLQHHFSNTSIVCKQISKPSLFEIYPPTRATLATSLILHNFFRHKIKQLLTDRNLYLMYSVTHLYGWSTLYLHCYYTSAYHPCLKQNHSIFSYLHSTSFPSLHSTINCTNCIPLFLSCHVSASAFFPVFRGNTKYSPQSLHLWYFFQRVLPPLIPVWRQLCS